MEPLTWVTIANLLAKHAFPVVEKLIFNAQNNVPVTVDEWDKLKKCAEFDDLVPKRTS